MSTSSSSALAISSLSSSVATGLTSIPPSYPLLLSYSSSSPSNSTLTLEQLLGYQPNPAAALIFCFLFLASAAVLLLLTCRTRTWFVLIGVVTAIAEAGGFGLRFYVAQHTDISIGPYVGSTLLILVSPNGLAALNYSALARMIRVFLTAQPPSQAGTAWRIPYFTDSAGRMLPSRIARTFICSDVLCIALQFAGSIMAGDADPQQVSTGHRLIVAGFSLQFIFFGLYSLLILRLYSVHRSLQREGAKLELVDRSVYHTARLSRAFLCIAVTIGLITCRNVYRMVEAENSAVASREVFTYLFDALLILACFAVFSYLHFGFFLPRCAPLSREEAALRDDGKV